jgi:hypothetical protein
MRCWKRLSLVGRFSGQVPDLVAFNTRLLQERSTLINTPSSRNRLLFNCSLFALILSNAQPEARHAQLRQVLGICLHNT